MLPVALIRKLQCVSLCHPGMFWLWNHLQIKSTTDSHSSVSINVIDGADGDVLKHVVQTAGEPLIWELPDLLHLKLVCL